VNQFEEIFAALNASGTRYVIVGGVAVNLHGHQRFTQDLDIVVELEPDRATRALEALAALGYRPSVPVRLSDFADVDTRERWIRERHMVVFQLYDETRRLTVDVFVRYPLPFEELWQGATEVALPTSRVRIASIDHLIRMKREAGRPQDLVDVDALETIRRLLEDEGKESHP
jgi:Uncharacterised nucleotidyltransferase